MNHSKKFARLGILSVACVSLLTLAVPASASLVTLRANLHGTDYIDWADSFGPEGNSFFGPKTRATHAHLPFSVNSVDGKLSRQNEGAAWSGNFARGDFLLSTGEARFSPEGPISITFLTGLSAIGAQIETRAYAPPDFDGVISVYDKTHLLETYTRHDGHSTNKGDNSAIFLGVTRSTADIFRVEFNTNTPTFEFAINQVDLIAGVPAGPVPEPSGLPMLALALLGSTLLMRRRPS